MLGFMIVFITIKRKNCKFHCTQKEKTSFDQCHNKKKQKKSKHFTNDNFYLVRECQNITKYSVFKPENK